MNLKKLFVEETDSTFIQFFRYCFVGGFATVVDWGCLLCFFTVYLAQSLLCCAMVYPLRPGLLLITA